MNRAVVNLGSNIDKEKNLPAAVQILSKACRVVDISAVYETLPRGPADQPNFFNAAVLIETELGPADLKERILGPIEKVLGRVRTGDKYAPRTIDVDLVLFNEEILEFDGRHIPDPDIVRFPHVAMPVADLVPDMPHPETGEPMRAIARRLLQAATAQNDGEPPIWLRPDVHLE